MAIDQLGESIVDHDTGDAFRFETLDRYLVPSDEAELHDGLAWARAGPVLPFYGRSSAVLELAGQSSWDEVAYGPRELDLVNTHQGARFGRGVGNRSAFTGDLRLGCHELEWLLHAAHHA